MWIDQLRSRVRESKRLTDDDINESIEQALSEYGGYYPYHVDVTVTSTGDSSYALPTNWVNGFSSIISLEYPLAEILIESNPNDYPIPAIRETTDYSIVGKTLHLMFEFPENEELRYTYVLPHDSESIESIPSHYKGAVMNLSTSYLLMKLAAIFAQSSDYRLAAEAVDYQNRADDYLEQARWYRQRWEQVLGIGEYSTDPNDNVFDVGETERSSSVLRHVEIDSRHRMFRPSYSRNVTYYT